MSRHVFQNAFQLFSRGLTDPKPSTIAEAYATVKRFHPKPPDFTQGALPVALRWFTLPALGFPRQSFDVFRHSGRFPDARIAGNINVTGGPSIIEWGRVNMFHVAFKANPVAGSSLTIQALDRTLRPIPGQTIAVTVNTNCRFRAPGTCALRVIGNGAVVDIFGATATACANVETWQLIERVGLPFNRGEIAAPVYDPFPQGFAPPAREGVEAAQIRLLLATMLHQPLPATGIATIPTPAWPAPDPEKYVDFLRSNDGVLRMIKKCLSNSDDTIAAKLQSEFIFHEVREGLWQTDIAGAQPGPDPTKFDIPVVAMSMLAVSTEPYAATALGYGTIDFPPKSEGGIKGEGEPPGFVTNFDYMVTNTYTFVGGLKLELAALALGRPDPEPAAALTAARLRRNRAVALDKAETESVQLQWNPPLRPQGYAVALSRKAGQSELLNSPRPFPQGFELFTPPREDNVEGGPPEGKITFTDPVSEVPITGTRQTNYLVAAGDVFGRWAAWSRTTYTAQAPPIQVPGLHSVTSTLDAATAVVRKVTGTLVIEFSWDWTDRSVSLIEFHGRFYTPSATPPAFAINLQIDSTAAAGAALIVGFDNLRNPSVTSAHDATVEIVTPVPADETRRYRLTIRQFKADFSAQSKLDYAVFARAEEKIRPGERSAPAGPRTTIIFDPLPPDVPPITADLRWTALPDAANFARGVLTWPSDPHALGYVVWEATEAALRHAIDPALPVPAAEVSLNDRALELATLLATEEARTVSSIAFSRVNTSPLPTNKIEVVLPGGSSTLYAYRVSSVSAANQESEKSDGVAWFAVPRRIKPGQPALSVRPVAGGFEITVTPAPGPAPAGYNVFRVRNSALLADPGLKGPPKIAANDPGWQDVAIGATTARRIVDNLAESWMPYYYQAVAIGQENLAAGEYAGESAPSTTIKAFLPPPGAPVVTLLSSASNADNRLLVFQTNIPAKPTDLGVATIEVIEVVRVPADGPLQRRPLLTVTASDVPLAAAPLGPPIGVVAPALTRTPNTPDGFTQFSLHFPSSVSRVVIVVRDPLSRMSELPFES